MQWMLLKLKSFLVPIWETQNDFFVVNPMVCSKYHMETVLNEQVHSIKF